MAAFSVVGLSAILTRVLPEPHAGLMAGLLFGTKTTISADLYQRLVNVGVVHIIALSGMNITIMEDLVGKSLVPLVGKRVASVVTIGVICWFVGFVGASASVVRAAIMGSLTLIAVLFGRQYLALFSWMLAVGMMLLLNFSWLFDVSFQLSALATLGIILFGTKEKSSKSAEVAHKNLDPSSVSLAQGSLSSGQNFVGSPPVFDPPYKPSRMALWLWMLVKDDLHLTLAAQVFTIPLILFHFHRISLIAPLTNLAIGWAIVPLTVLGWITVLVGFLWFPSAYMVGWIDWLFLEYIVRAVYMASLIPFASLGW